MTIDEPTLMFYLHNLEKGYNREFALCYLADEVWEALEAAVDLYERVEMDESVGVCLSDRTASLRLGAALSPIDAISRITTSSEIRQRFGADQAGL